MKILTIACFLTMLLLVASVHAQNSEQDLGFFGKPCDWKQGILFLRADIEERLRHSSLERERFQGREHLFRWLNPIEPLEQDNLPQVFEPACAGRLAGGFENGVETAWVKHYASGLAPGYDVATAMAIDGSGNVYVTGYSSNLPFGVDYLTVKYDASGNQIWTARYNSEDNGDDLASAICLDASGNVYVTGQSVGSETGDDYATIKYSPDGVQQWVARYNGPGNSTDEAIALAVDGSGNIYVTGRSVGSGTGYDYATVKYNAAGVEQWVSRYNGPGNDDDWVTALAVDGLSNVYVTGWSVDSGTREDYATVKYNAAGIEQWIRRYNGPESSTDEATALAVDGSGNVYVTGMSRGSGTREDYATVKYDAAGIEQWVSRYNGPGNSNDEALALAVDGSGNVYVTGRSWSVGTGNAYATVKYDATGDEQWVSRYNGPENSDDVATALAVDDSGNVYVTGSSMSSSAYRDYVTVKYDAAGVEQWVRRYNGPENFYDVATALAVDGSGNVYVTGWSGGSGVDEDYVTIKYNTAGVEQWVSRYNGPGNSRDWAAVLTMDGSGNVYVTGWSVGSGTGGDYATVKYNAAGIQQWVRRYNGPGNDDDWVTALAVDSSGNVYVTGRSWGSGTDYDYATVKYNEAGIEQWVSWYNGPGNSDDEAVALAVDDSGNVYVTGWSAGSGTNDDYATVKYNAAGIEQWVRRYNGSGNASDRATALAVDGSGNIYVTGRSRGSGTRYDYVTIKYDAAGIEQWIRRYNGPESSTDEAIALAVDGSGNVYVTGRSVGSGTGYDYATVKYNATGVEQWVSRYNGPGNSADEALALAVDGSGNVYVTGRSVGSGTSYDYATVKYNEAGVEQWVSRYNGPRNSDDEVFALAVDDSGNVYVTGSSMGLGAYRDYVTVKYNAAGVEQWVSRYNGPGNSDDEALALVVDGSGNVYVTGRSAGYYWSIYTTIKYVQIPVVVKMEEPDRPTAYWLSQNYPNPFNPTTTIRFALPRSGQVRLAVYNVLGQLVTVIVDGHLEVGQYKVTWDASGVASGIYIARLEANGEVRQIKMCVVK